MCAIRENNDVDFFCRAFNFNIIRVQLFSDSIQPVALTFIASDDGLESSTVAKSTHLRTRFAVFESLDKVSQLPPRHASLRLLLCGCGSVSDQGGLRHLHHGPAVGAHSGGCGLPGRLCSVQFAVPQRTRVRRLAPDGDTVDGVADKAAVDHVL